MTLRILPMLILASRSPQRKAILKRLGVVFEVMPSPFDESTVLEKDPKKRAVILAEKKAEVIAKGHPDQWVIGVDTLVVASDGTLLEKPSDAEDARHMLRLHSGNISTVHSGLSLQRGSECHSALSSARVTFRTLSEKDIDWWISTELWEERSGAFQIEGEGQKLIHSLEGELETVVGFPVQIFLKKCRELKVHN